LVEHLHKKEITEIHYVYVADNWLKKRLHTAAKKHNIQLYEYPSPSFLNQLKDVDTFFDKQKTYFQTDFYKDQRRQRRLLMEDNGTPIGGKWTYDNENRLRFPKGEIIPEIDLPKNNKYVTEAIDYVEKNYSSNYGNTEPPFFKRKGFFPVNFEEAEKWLDDFLQQRFEKFGVYEDAMVKEQGLLYHSALSPMLNIGLLTPQKVVDKALDAAVNFDIPINSLEGFIRQIVGWREYIHIVYEREGSLQRTKNYWGFTRKIPPGFWEGNTGIHPIDIVIKKVLQNGYSHHIERLMVMGNFMLLCEFDPDDVYRWFMEMYVDAYDWVREYDCYCAFHKTITMHQEFCCYNTYCFALKS
jgi:deoxyribodipyrimidine photolyase-related protein